MRNQWGLFKCKRKKGVVWYYWYYDEKGVRQHQSTGKSVKWQAEEYVEDKFAQASTNPDITLREFVTDFFDYETSRWINRRIARGYEVTRPMADMRAGHLKNHILIAFGSRKVTEIRAIEIEDWLLNLDKKSNTKNHILGTFRSEEGAQSFCALHSYISTAGKHGINVMSALEDIFTDKKLLPHISPTNS